MVDGNRADPRGVNELDRRELIAAGSVLAIVAASSTARGNELPGTVDHVAPGDAAAALNPERRRLDRGWRFTFGHLDDPARDFGYGVVAGAVKETLGKQGHNLCTCAAADFDDSAWQAVDLPHDWAVGLPFVPNLDPATIKPNKIGLRTDPMADRGFKPLGRDYPATSVGWYRKTIMLSPQDRRRRVRLDFDGVFRQAMIIVNGYLVSTHEGGYAPFSVDVTDFINTDDSPNVLTVRVDASLAEGWFYEGAGIYRHVWLSCHDALHVPLDGVVVRAETDGSVEVLTTLRNDGDRAATATVTSAVPGTGAGASQVVVVDAWQSVTLKQRFRVDSPRLWSVDEPTLYRVETSLDALLAATTRFGFRSIRFDAEQGFFLNGKSLKLLGTCNHQDHAGVGTAVPDALWYYRLRLLKEMGSNAYRTAHNPPARELLDACDELGMLVIDETRMMTSSPTGMADLAAMIVRDRNHPSIILWSIGNEEPQQGTERGARIARSMKRLVNKLDPTRPITAAMNADQGKGITPVLDVLGFNYNDDKIDGFHARFPQIPIVGTETASTVATRGEYARDPARHIVPAYDTDAPPWAQTAEQWWPHFDAKRFIAGGFIWTGFDYRGEPTPFSFWPSISSQFGVFDTCGFPKDNYYYYRAWWRAEPLLHLFPHWNWEPGENVDLWVYGNCDEVELVVNGRTRGRKPMPRNRHVAWTVPFQAGRIEARGYVGGRLVSHDARETTGTPAAVALTTDRRRIAADGRDCAVLRAEIVDARGRPVPSASNLVRFELLGPGSVIGVGNGDPNCHEPDKATRRSAFNGLCSAIVQAHDSSGDIVVIARAAGLAAGRVVITAT